MARLPIVNGLALLDLRMVDDSHLAPNDGGATNSSYTEAEPIPGRVTHASGQTWVPVLTGGQGDDAVNLSVVSSGYAGGARVTYDVGGAEIGWNGIRACQWEAVAEIWGTGAGTDLDLHSTVVLPRSQKLVLVYAQEDGLPLCRTKAVGGDWSASSAVGEVAVGSLAVFVVPRPNEDTDRLVLVSTGAQNQILTRYSDDEGATWPALADDGTIVPTAANRCKVAIYGQQVAAFFYVSGSTDIYHFASADLGISWSFVGAAGAESFTLGLLDCATTTRGIAVAGDAGAGTQLTILPHAFAAFDTVASIEVTSTTTVAATAVVTDWDGTLYVLEVPDTSGEANVYETRDQGRTWSEHAAYNSGDTAIELVNPDFVSWGGRLTVISQYAGISTRQLRNLGELRLSDWSTLTWDADPLVTWIAGIVPSASPNWTLEGATAGTTDNTGYLSISVAASTGSYLYTGTASLTAAAHFTMVRVSGGTSTGDQIIASVLVSDGVETYHMRVRFHLTGFRVRDNIAGSNVVDVAVAPTTDLEIMMGFDGSSGFLYYKRPEEFIWTEVTQVRAHSFSDGGAIETVWKFRMGHVLSSTSSSLWKNVTLYTDPGVGGPFGNNLSGKRVTGSPYPLRGVVDADGNVGFLSARGGLAIGGETYSIEPEHRFPLRNVFPALSPSPSRRWRSQDTTEQVIAFDLAEDSRVGDAIAVYVDDANIRTLFVEYHDGVDWVEFIEYDGATGFANLEYDRAGDVLAPAGGTDPSARYLQGSEKVGGFAICDATAHHILDNTDGWWRTIGAEVRTPRVRIDNAATAAASGALHLVSGSGLHIEYLTAEQLHRRWRIRIPAQLCPDSYFEAGVLAVGEFVPFGQEFGWGWSAEREGTYEAETDRRGTEVRTQTGDHRGSWFLAWPEGVPEVDVHGSTAGDVRATATGLPLALKGSTRFQLLDALERTQGQTIPVIAVAAAPTASATITDPTAFLYGYLTSSVAWAAAQGREGRNLVGRGETVEVRGIP